MNNHPQNSYKKPFSESPLSSDFAIHHYLPLERFRQLATNGLYVRSAFNFDDKNDCLVPLCSLSGNSSECGGCGTPTFKVDSDLLKQIKQYNGNVCGVFGVLKFYINEKLNFALSRSHESVFTDRYVYALADIFSAHLRKDSNLENYLPPSIKQKICELFTEIEKEKYRCSFISSWTDDAPEKANSKGWELHAGTNGVCISSTIEKMTSAFSDARLEVEAVDRVVYFNDYERKFNEQKASSTLLSTDYIDDWIFIKDDKFSDESEIRFYLHPKFPYSHFDLCKGYICDHRYVPLKGAITKVTGAPTCTPAANAEIELLTKQYINCPFSESGKTANPPLWSRWKDEIFTNT